MDTNPHGLGCGPPTGPASGPSSIRRLPFFASWLPGLVIVVAFAGALVWAKHRDPFERVDFTLRAGAGKTHGVVVLPKPTGRFPVVVFLHGAGGGVATCGKVLRQFAELGCAAVAIEYSQTNQAHFDEQLLALHQYLRGRGWAQSNAMAWVGFSLGAQRSLSFLLRHPEIQPQLYVRIAGGLVEELAEGKWDKPGNEGEQPEAEGGRPEPAFPRSAAAGHRPDAVAATAHSNPDPQLTAIRCRVLLVHGEKDGVFSAADCERLRAMLVASGARVEAKILPGQPHDFGGDFAVVIRAVAEYCIAQLPRADYAASLRNCRLTPAERARFNEAMSRAGGNRRALWKAVASLHEPERRTAMMVIGGLEDYDLAHLSAAHLREIVKVAWKARQTYPWCKATPQEIFEKFTAAPRVFEERLERVQATYQRKLRPVVKYCHSIAEVCDTVGRWERKRAVWKSFPGTEDPTPGDVIANGGGDCQHLISLFIALARSVGVAARPVTTTWPILGSDHFWAEIWNVERERWHAFDGSASDRPFNFEWMARVPKAATHAVTGERGSWNARREGRWEAFTNTVVLF